MLMGIKHYPWIPINTFYSSQSRNDASPWSMHNHITIMSYHVVIVCFYCLWLVTHIGLLIADMIIHELYSFNDS